MTMVQNEKDTTKVAVTARQSSFQKFVRGPYPAYSLVFVDFFGLGCIMPLLPFFCKDFEDGGVWLGAIMTAQAGGVVIGIFLVGTLSDMFGRKRLGIYAMIGDGIFFFLSGSMTTPLGMLLVRFFAGMFCPIPCAYGWVIDVSPVAEVRAKRLGLTTAFIMGGMFFGFSVAGVVGEFLGMMYAMLIPSILAFINAFFIILFVPNPSKEGKKGQEIEGKGTDHAAGKKPNPAPVLRTGRWLAVSLINFAVGLQVGHFTAVAMMMMVKKHGLTPSGLAVFNVSTICVMILANAFFFPWCYKKLGPNIMMPLFICVSGVFNGAAFFFEFNLPLYMVLMIPGFLLTMTLLPSGQTIAADLTKRLAPDAIGTIQGVTRMSLDLGKTFSPVISTVLYGNGEGTFVSYLWVTVIMMLAGINFAINGKKGGIVQTENQGGNGPDVEFSSTINKEEQI